MKLNIKHFAKHIPQYAFVVLLALVTYSCSSSKNEMFKKEVEEQNRLLPMMVDAYTRIDSIRYADNAFFYFYTLLNAADRVISEWERKELSDKMLKEIKSAAGMKLHRDHKVTMNYIYLSETTGEELFKIHITPEMYQ